jgi:hypothetical protein
MQNKKLRLSIFITLSTLAALPVTLASAQDTRLIQDKAPPPNPQQPQVKQLQAQNPGAAVGSNPLTDAQVIERVAQGMGETVPGRPEVEGLQIMRTGAAILNESKVE